MKIGKPKFVPWHKYKTSKFHFPSDIGKAQCGAYALHAITKKSYKDIEKLSKNECWPTVLMFKYLKQHGYEIHPITIGNMVEAHSVNDFTKSKITENHVILIDQKAYKEENTWAVLYGNMMGHSGETEALKPLEFFNYPMEAAYVIWHNKWK